MASDIKAKARPICPPKTASPAFPPDLAAKFPALFEMYYVFGQHSGYRESMKAETGKGFDIGFDPNLKTPELRFYIALD